MEEKKKEIRISVRNLVEFILRSGDLDNSSGGFGERDAMQAGIVIGEVARIDGLIQAVWDELGYETRVVATGDDAQAMAGLSRRIEVADDQLTLKGLILLHQKNRKAR